MDRRTKILGGVFGAVMLYAFVSAVAYPKWIAPLMTLDDLIAELQVEQDRLEDEERETEQAKRTYRRYLDRVGSFDAVAVENDLRERLNHLISKHSLVDQNVSGRRPSTDRKTGIQKMMIAITASGSLESVVAFLEEVSELPHLIRIGNTVIYPASSSRRGEVGPQRMNLRVPLEVWILPPQRVLGQRLTSEDLKRPNAVVRHDEDSNYALIWEREPFTPYVPPKPLVASAGRNMIVNVGDQALLQGKATGGVGDYSYRWEPAEEVTDPTSPRPNLTDTSKLGDCEFTLTVTDEGGNTSTGTVTVTIREPEQIAEVETDEPTITVPPKPASPQRWADGRNMRLTMALIRIDRGQRESEFMVYDGAKEETSYYAPGDPFDGGELVYVHPRGAVVRRQDDYFVYPIGSALNEDLPAAEAVEYPELQRIASAFNVAQAAPEEFDEEASGEGAELPPAEEGGGGDAKPTTAVPQAGSEGGVDPTTPEVPRTGVDPSPGDEEPSESEPAAVDQPGDETKDSAAADEGAEAPRHDSADDSKITPADGGPGDATKRKARSVVKNKRGVTRGAKRARPNPAKSRTKRTLPVKRTPESSEEP